MLSCFIFKYLLESFPKFYVKKIHFNCVYFTIVYNVLKKSYYIYNYLLRKENNKWRYIIILKRKII